jgi:cytochrome c-type biogenesis protein CcmE
MKSRRRKYLLAGGLVLVALAGLVYSGVQQAMVYFYTPTEIRDKPASLSGKALRVGGMVAKGSVRWEPQTRLLSFTLTDGQASVPVRHQGTAPDLFQEGTGAVVEGTWVPEGYLRATLIMAKHSEEYTAPHSAETLEGKKALFKSLLGEKRQQ